MSSVDVILGSGDELGPLLGVDPTDYRQLGDNIAHVFNQTLQRDLYFGSWADAYYHEPDGQYHVKLTSPDKDLSLYETTIPNMLQAMGVALATYRGLTVNTSELKFYLPFGLSMAAYKAVQLLHFPPSEAMQFCDYLYNPTARRWELLLHHNGFNGRENTLVERLVDLVPFAAAGGDAAGIKPYELPFAKYAITMLEVFLKANARIDLTAPTVVGGGPAIACIQTAYADQLPKGTTLQPESLVALEIVPGRKTNLLCTNHPSKYLYPAFGSHPDHKEAKTIMRQDLVCAGWEAAMAEDWTLDPHDVLVEMKLRWKSDKKVEEVMKESGPEWSFSR